MTRKLEQHTELKHWKIIHKSQVPRNAKPIPMVWTLRRKRDPAGEILTEFRQPLQVQSHLEMTGILVQLGHIQRT